MSNRHHLKRARRRLIESTGPYWDDFSDLFNELTKRWEDVRAFYRAHEWFRSVCHGSLALLGTLLLDALSGHAVGFRLMFMVPVFVASIKGDWFASGFVTVATMIALTALDYRHGNLANDSASLSLVVNVVSMAATATVIVAMQRKIRRIGQIANHDALTGAMTRSAIQQYAENVLYHARNEGCPAVVAVIDCDGFKTINDLYGHAVGDAVLISLVESLKRLVGSHGAVGRIGGDEFVVVFDNRTRSFAGRLLDRAREAFVDSTSALAPGCSFTFGVAKFKSDGESYGELVQAADSNMYRAKTAVVTIKDALKVC